MFPEKPYTCVDLADDLDLLISRIRQMDESRLDLLLHRLKRVETDSFIKLVQSLERFSGEENPPAPAALPQSEEESEAAARPSPQELADDLELLSGRIRDMGDSRLGFLLYHTSEMASDFAKQVDVLKDISKDPSPESLRIQARVEEMSEDAKRPHDWPEVAEPVFEIEVDIVEPEREGDFGDLVLRVGEQVLYRRATWYEGTDHLFLVCNDMREAYKGRIRNYRLTNAASNCLWGDDYQAPGKVRKAFRKIMRDFQKARERENARNKGE